MDIATWWQGVKPIFEFGATFGFAVILLFTFLADRKRILDIMGKLTTVTLQQAAVLAAIRDDIQSIREAHTRCGAEMQAAIERHKPKG